MKIKKFNKLDLELYYEKLPNGLEVFIVPKNNVNNIYVTFSTKFGSRNIEFIPLEETKMKKVPLGTAHFLEHQLFEQNGIEPFTFFSERGASLNANTSILKTTYLFSSPNKLEENLNFLIDFVQNPSFTDKTVEKEKGIIEQEINMYADDPFYALYDKSLYNTIVKDSSRYPIIGSIKSINKITKEDLFTSYKTFYHPSNMFLVITGNVDPNKTLNIIKENQEIKQFILNSKEITVKKYKEPNTVFKKEETILGNVVIPKTILTFKVPYAHLNKREFSDYLIMYFSSKFGQTSLFYEQLKEQKIISGNLAFTIVDIESHILCMLIADTKKPSLLHKLILNEINKDNLTKEEFKRKKKTILSSLFYLSDDIFKINNKIMNNIINENEVLIDDYGEISKYNYSKFKQVIKDIDFSNYTIVNLMPKN